MKNVILVKASSNIQDLTGVGMEYLLDKSGKIIAIFSEGMFIASNRPTEKGDPNEITRRIA